MKANDRIFVAGHRGMVGSAIVRLLKSRGYNNLILKTSSEVNLMQQSEVDAFFAAEKPDYVFMAAAKVGGILANNTYRAEFLYNNLMIAANVTHAAHAHGVTKMLFLGSSCIYPKLASQPLAEDSLLTGPLEPTNEPYAIAKIAGIKLAESYRDQYGSNFISAMPTNLYGPGDNYDLQTSHVLPALLRKFHEAKRAGDATVTCWGSGTPMREFLHVNDMAEACLFLMDGYDEKPLVNVGTGTDVTIRELAETISRIVGFEGEIVWDSSKPDGTPRKLMDVSRINNLGWKHQIDLEEGIAQVYQDFLAAHPALA